MSTPRFSIITATFNRAAMLREAIASLQEQGRDDVEHLIIDGASTDGTRELLAEYPHLRVVSESDRGIYDAFNKGLDLARGEIIHFLNSDDLLVPGALTAAHEAFADPSVELVSGGMDFFIREPDGSERVIRKEDTEAALAFSLRQVLRGVPGLNARFFRRGLLERVGRFDLGLRIVADRDFLVRTALLRPRSVVLPRMVYRYRSHADSLTVKDSEDASTAIRAEHVTMAERRLEQPLAAEDLTELAALHRRETAVLAVDALTAGAWREARRWTQRGWAVSGSWPVAGLVRLGGWMLGRSSRYTLAREESAPR